MITEDYVSFETAKLLKKKGFDEYTFSDYSEDGIVGFNEVETKVAKGYQRPTLQMVMKWLREVHKIFLDINFIQEHFCFIRIVHNEVEENFVVYFSTYEQACEAAIKYCLENLIECEN